VIDDALDEFSAPAPARVVAAVRRRRPWGRLRVVWFGNAGLESPPFGLVHVAKVVPALEDLHARRPLRLTVVSNGRPAYEKALSSARFPHAYVEWTPSSFVRVFPRQDVCIIPIEPNRFTLAKTGNRAALSLRLGVPVIADPIPSFEEFAPFILLDDWPESLERYASDPELRRRHALEGRQYVMAKFTKARVVEQWGGFLAGVLDGRGGRVGDRVEAT
jgi:glycosyltransferase involved in cell wall biosynthesis